MFSPIRTVVFRTEILVTGDAASRHLVPEAPGALATLRFIGVRTVIRTDATMTGYLTTSGLAAMADAVITTTPTASPEVMIAGSDPKALAAALAAGCRAAVIGEAVVPGAHRVADLDALVALVRDESLEARRTGAGGFRRDTRNLLADFRGLPSEISHADERPMARPNGLAGTLVSATDGDAAALKALSAMARGVIGAEEAGMDARDMLLDSWSKLVPAKLAKVCFPVDLNGDTLAVLCTTPVARNEMKFVERALIAAVRRLPGCSGVNRVVYRL